MSAIESFAAWLESTRIAEAVGTSMWSVASLSAVHVLGYTLVMGGALLANLRLMGVILRKLPVAEVIRPASRGILAGLLISIPTGILLVSWKASTAFLNGTFQIKMLLLLAAALLHFTWQRTLVRREATRSTLLLAGALGLALWLGLALAACAFILFE